MSIRNWVLAALGTTAVVMTVLLSGSSSSPRNVEGGPATLGTPHKYGHLTVTALAAGENLGNPEQAPAAGNKWVFVLVSAKNDGANAYDVVPAEKAWLIDGLGERFPAFDSLGDKGLFVEGGLEGEIPPTEAVRGEIGFEVPATARDLVFTFGDSDVSWTLPQQTTP